MRETRLWDNLRPSFDRAGKFYKTSDRFTLGVADVLGVATVQAPVYIGSRVVHRPTSIAYALELKEFDGVRILRVSFRVGQLDFLRDWEAAGGRAWIVASHRESAYVFRWEVGPLLEEGIGPDFLEHGSRLTRSRGDPWPLFARSLLELTR